MLCVCLRTENALTNGDDQLCGQETLAEDSFRLLLWVAILNQPSSTMRKFTMNWDQIEGNWKQFKGNAKQQWGKLTDDQLDVIAGKRDHLAGKIQETYGITKEATEKQLSDWQARMKEIKHT